VNSIKSFISVLNPKFKEQKYYFASSYPDLYKCEGQIHCIKINNRLEVINKIDSEIHEGDILILAPESIFIDKVLIKKIVSLSLKDRFLLVVPYPAMVRLGATISVYYDYYESLSTNITKYLSDDYKNKKFYVYKPKLYINKKTLDFLNITLKMDGYDYDLY